VAIAWEGTPPINRLVAEDSNWTTSNMGGKAVTAILKMNPAYLLSFSEGFDQRKVMT
jgi:hypothetical protein